MPHHLDSVPTANLGKAAPVELRALGAVVINAGHRAGARPRDRAQLPPGC